MQQNPLLQNAIASSVMNSVVGHEGDESHKSAAEGIPEEELARIKYWSNILRMAMLVISVLMIITAYLNFSSSSSPIEPMLRH